MDPPSTDALIEGVDPELVAACRAVLAPLAKLAVARGLTYSQIDELLRAALVDAARAAHGDVAAQRAVSRVSTATGLHRREVTRRLAAPSAAPPSPRPSLAIQVFARWLNDRQLRGKGRVTRKLPRQGPWPSFETLAQSVTLDVRPRTLLEEMRRLGLVTLNEATDNVELVRDTFVPQGDQQRMYAFLAANVGDHLAAAVSNVLTDEGPHHLEQALFAHGLSEASLQKLRPLIAAQWQVLTRKLVPAVQELIDQDRAAGRTQDQRVRVGMYAYSEHATGSTGPPPGDSDVQD